MCVAIRIYAHVGYEFRVFGQEQDRSSSSDLSATSSVERNAIKKAIKEHRSHIMSNEKKRHRYHNSRRLECTATDAVKNISQRFRSNFTSQRRPKSLSASLALAFRRAAVSYPTDHGHLRQPNIPQQPYLPPRQPPNRPRHRSRRLHGTARLRLHEPPRLRLYHELQPALNNNKHRLPRLHPPP